MLKTIANFSHKLGLVNFDICKISEYEKDWIFFKSYGLVLFKTFLTIHWQKSSSHMSPSLSKVLSYTEEVGCREGSFSYLDKFYQPFLYYL